MGKIRFLGNRKAPSDFCRVRRSVTLTKKVPDSRFFQKTCGSFPKCHRSEAPAGTCPDQGFGPLTKGDPVQQAPPTSKVDKTFVVSVDQSPFQVAGRIQPEIRGFPPSRAKVWASSPAVCTSRAAFPPTSGAGAPDRGGFTFFNEGAERRRQEAGRAQPEPRPSFPANRRKPNENALLDNQILLRRQKYYAREGPLSNCGHFGMDPEI